MLFLRLVSFILNREGEKGGKVFEIVPDKEQAGSRMAICILTIPIVEESRIFPLSSYLLMMKLSFRHPLPS